MSTINKERIANQDAVTKQADTRLKLIEAATEVFAEVGFRGATIREICQRAGANIAAINYHFGDKAGLYSEAMRYGFEELDNRLPDTGLDNLSGTAEERFRTFVRNFLLRIIDNDPSSAHSRMMAREMVEPTQVLDEIIESYMRPTSALLYGIISDLVGKPLPQKTAEYFVMSVIGQCVFYKHCNPVISKLAPIDRSNKKAIMDLADHITDFSLAGIYQIAKKSGRK